MKNRTVIPCLFLCSCLTALSGCKQAAATDNPPSLTQGALCIVRDTEPATSAAACRQGQKVLFVPPSFGNQQLPVIFAALHCDSRYAIALTDGAVSCIYAPSAVRPAANAGGAEEKH